MEKIRIGIIRGMAGDHYESSLIKGGDIIAHIQENLSDKYKPVDILIDKNYIWHLGGLPVAPSDLVHKIDVAWNVSHQSLSNILESLAIPNVGASIFSSLVQGNRAMLREHAKNIGVNMPRHIVLPLYQKDFDGEKSKYAIKKAKEVFAKFGSPWIVKSFTPDSSMGIHVAKTFPELVNAIEDGVRHQKSILVEEFILGKVASVHSVANFRGEEIYIFPLSNPFDNPLGHFSSDEKENLIALAKNLHQHLGAKHYLKSNFVLNPNRGIFLSDVEFSPDLRKDSHFCRSCESIGAKMHHVVEHILERAVD